MQTKINQIKLFNTKFMTSDRKQIMLFFN